MKTDFEPNAVYIRPLKTGEFANDNPGHLEYGAFDRYGTPLGIFEKREDAFELAREKGAIPYHAH